MHKLIDIFSGPGGLGEGFASLADRFKVSVSAEMEASAHETLMLRSLYRHIKSSGSESDLTAYYDFCNSSSAKHPRDALPAAWKAAADEARQLTLGDANANRTLEEILKKKNLKGEEVVVIGGPPCQAYSLVGRARNKGVVGYVAEEDHRHYLYKEYLQILHLAKPAAFVMENVKGILSSKVNGRLVFHDILRDLCDPSKAVGKGRGQRYSIHSLVTKTRFNYGMEPEDIDAHDFVVRAEKYGIPQARHRVILLGVCEDIGYDGQHQLTLEPARTVRSALHELPEIRSQLSTNDGAVPWRATVRDLGIGLSEDALRKGDAAAALFMADAVRSVQAGLTSGALRMPGRRYSTAHGEYFTWVRDPRLEVWLNHGARSHMTPDLGRYLYAAAFAKHYGRSPKSRDDFKLKGLAPAHANWDSGKFIDRFRVQQYDQPSTTITSHIAKDGHYFIHPEPGQCRSLTVREAARLQTFPDNYFFQGNRTQQYHQVGNAVPPLLANKIATIVSKILSSYS